MVGTGPLRKPYANGRTISLHAYAIDRIESNGESFIAYAWETPCALGVKRSKRRCDVSMTRPEESSPGSQLQNLRASQVAGHALVNTPYRVAVRRDSVPKVATLVPPSTAAGIIVSRSSEIGDGLSKR